MTTLPPPLDTLDAAQQALLTERLEPMTFPAGTTIFRGGDAGDGCYLIDAGEVRLELPHPELDTEGVLGYLQAGEVLGEMSLLDREPRSATARAETDVEVRRLSSEALDALLADHAGVALGVVSALGRDAARKLRAANVLAAEHLFADTPDPEVDDMVARAARAQQEFETWDEDRVDALLSDVAQAIAERAAELARRTVEETHVGNVDDKTLKNTFASLGILQSLLGRPGRGPLAEPDEGGVMEIAAPAGVVFGIIPMTNPVATAIFKALIALKARNALILSFHRSCLGVGSATGEAILEVLARHGAPVDLVQWVRSRVDRKKTARFMSHPGVSLVLATGGPGMVRAAYSSGTPAIGVGSGNAPTWITESADIPAAAAAIVMSKSFDHGLICGSEHNLLVDARVRDRFVDALESAGAAVLDEEERDRFLGVALNEERTGFRVEIIGQGAGLIAQFAGVVRDHEIKLIVVPTEPDLASPLAGEKMSPVLSLFTVEGDDEALALSLAILGKQGRGHTAIVHSTDPAQIERFAEIMPASRILANSGGAQGVCGISTGLEPSFTLGCGTFGGNSTSDNVSYRNLQNVKRLAHGAPAEAPVDVTTTEAAPVA